MSRGVQYTPERLAAAAAQCSDIDEVITYFGTRPYGKLRIYLTRRFAHFGIDISHFRSRTTRARPTHDELRVVIAESISIAEVLRRLDRPDNSRNRALLRQWLTEGQLTIEHFLGQAHLQGKSRPSLTRSAEDVLVQHGGSHRTRTELLRRALRETGVPEECAECGIGPEWRGKPMTLEVDHVNGGLERRPAREPAVTVPQLPCDHQHVVQRRKPQPHASPVVWASTRGRC